MLGTKPLYKCRSEPQIAVLVMRMMASWELRSLGSGTSSTLTFFLPNQQLAFIAGLLWSGLLGRLPLVVRGAARGECSRPSAAPPRSPAPASGAANRPRSVGSVLHQTAWRTPSPARRPAART